MSLAKYANVERALEDQSEWRWMNGNGMP